MARHSRRKAAQVDHDDNEETELPLEAGVEQVEQQQQQGSTVAHAVLPAAVRERNRAVAEREASRLARPERRVVGTLGHASKSKSAVASTPSGVHPVTSVATAASISGNSTKNNNLVENDPGLQQEWCGPFSVARQVRSTDASYLRAM